MKTVAVLATVAAFAGSALAAPAPQGTETYDLPIESYIPAIVPVNTRANDPTLISALRNAGTYGQRHALLDQPGDYVFDFANPVNGSVSMGNGGHTVGANPATFPALIGNGASTTVGFLGPCGLNTPHVHPRGTELNLIIQGRLVTNFIPQNGVPPRENLMNTFQMSVFPLGAIHSEYNPDCTDAIFVAGFSDEDAGVNGIAENFFGLRPDIVAATLGGVDLVDGADLETFREFIPANVANGVEACLVKCGIQKKAKRELPANHNRRNLGTY